MNRKMTLDEAIKTYTSNAEYERTHGNLQGCLDFKQLVKWLKELKQLREQVRWIPVDERSPDDGELVLFSTKTDRVFEGRYFDDNTNRQWYSFRDKTFAWNNVVTAWRPSPEPYKAESGSKVAQVVTSPSDVVALDFSDDIDTPNKYQTADGKWHEGRIPTIIEDKIESEDK